MLTLSTCSNVCILTDYPFSLDLTQDGGANFAWDYTRAMGTLPRADGLTSALSASYHSGTLTVSAQRDGGWPVAIGVLVLALVAGGMLYPRADTGPLRDRIQ